MTNYNNQFYKERIDSLISAKVIVPLILETFKPQSVVDVGCGTGEFLSVFIEYGVEDILGIDGEWVPKNQLRIPLEKFLPMNLETPSLLNRRFDLVLSLEVAEHLSPHSSERFVEFLTSLGDIIVFSAAIPGQGGLNHINERWPDEWKQTFEKFNFVLYDVFRKNLWYNTDVAFWYSQNTFLFLNKERKDIPNKYKFSEGFEFPSKVVHYKLYEKKIEELKRIYSFIPKPLLNTYLFFKKFFSFNPK